MPDTYAKPRTKRKANRDIFVSWLDGSSGEKWQGFAEKSLDEFEKDLDEALEAGDSVRQLKKARMAVTAARKRINKLNLTKPNGLLFGRDRK